MNQEQSPEVPKDNQIMTADSSVTPQKKGINLVLAIGVAVTIALILAGTSLYIFMRSDTREIMQAADRADQNKTDESLSETPDDTNSLSSEDLSKIEQDITNSTSGIGTDDFGSSEVTDAALGL